MPTSEGKKKARKGNITMINEGKMRNALCGNLRLKDEGREVRLAGWLVTKRNLGGILFLDIRDRSGICQVRFDDPSLCPEVHNEYLLSIEGTVEKKPVANKKLESGEVEVKATSCSVISKSEQPPFIIADETDALEETRLKYRYLDLRRPILAKRLRTRAKICRAAREYLEENGFLEVETPCLNLATPEGARDYLVPSRTKQGRFYALPQSPQLFKQLLMVGGIERYYQIARCFRDEDLRADRQPEFTQIDVECSFLSQDEILELGEGLVRKIFLDAEGIELPAFERMAYWDAMDFYGSDKPDLRYELKMSVLDDIVPLSSFPGAKDGSFVRALKVEGYAEKASRKKLDALQLEARKNGLEGPLFLFKEEGGEFLGSGLKFLSEDGKALLVKRLAPKDGDAIFLLLSSNRRKADFALGSVRIMIARELGLTNGKPHKALWVVDFPMFTYDEEEGRYVAEHHPFTRPRDEDLGYLDSDPSKVLAYAYDVVIDGYEAGGGTLRIYDPILQDKIFRLMGLSEEEVRSRFGWFVDAFKYAAPPHGGFALGLDRLSMLVTHTENIRDVIAFPKNLLAVDPMSGAPGDASEKALEDLSIAVVKKD